jgi:DNA-binding winged helix-turn-helix (wHTH) protein/tetratricopeptide (TPR) repeat protein/TolB-like protein
MDRKPLSSDFKDFYEFDAFRLEARERRLWRGKELIALKPKVFDTLLLLVQNAGHLVTKEDLMSSLWPDAVVDEGNLTKNMWLIRKALVDAENDSPIIETVPRIGYRFAATVRAAGAGEAPSASREPPEESTPIAGPDVQAAQGTSAPPRNRPSWTLPVFAAAALCALAIAVWVWRSRVRPAGNPMARTPGSVPSRRSVAVLGFKNLSGRPDVEWLSTAVSEMMSAELAAGEKLRLVPMENVARIAGARIPESPWALSRESLRKLRTSLDADLVLTGSFVAISSPPGEVVRFDMVLQDASTGDSVAAVTETGNANALFGLVSAAGTALRGKLGLDETSPSEGAAVAASLPANPEAARLYAEGLERLRLFDAAAASDLFGRAIRAEPDFPFAHEALSRAWKELGYDARAIDEAGRALKLSGKLSHADQLSLRAASLRQTHRYAEAAATEKSLFEVFPDNLEYGLRLAQDTILAGRPKDGLVVLKSLRGLPGPAGDDPRIDFVEANAEELLGEWGPVIEASDRAIRKAVAQGAASLAAEAWLDRAYALDSLDRNSEKEAADREAARLFKSGGNRNGEARALVSLANISSGAGDLKGAMSLYDQALATFRDVGNRDGIAVALSDLSLARWRLGDARGARDAAEQVLAIRRETNHKAGIAWALCNLGEILADRGELDRAGSLQEEALGIARQTGNNDYVIYALYALAGTKEIRGDLGQARSLYEEAFELSRKAGDVAGTPERLCDLARVVLNQGDTAAAERYGREALKLAQERKERQPTAEAQAVLAHVLLAGGRISEAASLAARAAAEFQAEGFRPEEAVARIALGLAERGERRLPEAVQAERQALSLIQGIEENGCSLPVEIGAARIEAAAGNADKARRLIEQARELAAKAHWRGYFLEARLVASELDLRGGQRAAAEKQIQEVGEEGREAGFQLISREALTLLRDSRPVAR